ncbi:MULTISPECIES: hypothetical protein [unclassified Pseudomonas]|uniref:hypothetical protein n=1 Tax=unclassified Pseudomonas TaxID=196821 RepID=UPI001A9F6AFA|nr:MULTISPECIES: hypothetical protein [unclassified Pseudomonas]
MHPEHHDLSTAVYLPVTDETCASLLQPEGATTLGELTDAQLAAVLVIQNLAQAAEKDLTAAAAEKVLARLIAWAVDGRTGLLSEAQRLFDPRQLYFGLNALRRLNLRLLLAEEVAAQDYLLPDGKWDDEFKTRHHAVNNPFSQQMISPIQRERWLSPAQDKLVRTFRANLDEDLHVQGYAGIGKSHLLGALTECLEPRKTLLLARTPEKLATLSQRMGITGDRKPGITFEAFARGLIHGRRPQTTATAARLASKQSVAQALNILGFRGHDAQRTFNVCLETLERYCQSRDYSLSAQHLPYFQLSLSSLESKVLLEYSSRVWSYLEANPAWGRQSGFEALLLIKRASLAGCVVPPRYTHVLIDESQDIPASLLQIIERGRQVLITLGDEYQHASRDLVKRKREVRQSDITYSVRSGRNVERLVNPLISRHSEKTKVPFEGASEADVGIEFYPQGFVPPEGCVVLTASPWDTMMWAMQLHDANCLFSFPDMKAQRDLEHFMTTAIELFKVDYYSAEHSEKGPHRYFSDLPDWQQVRAANRFDEAFLWVEAELQKGFKVADLTRLIRMIGAPGKSCMLMQAQEAGGMEFDRVLLTPELLTNVKFKDAYAFDERICAVYIAISRARQQLFLPYDVVEWIEFHDYQKFRESHGY